MFTNQFDGVAGLLEGVDGVSMWHVDHRHVVDREDGVVDAEAAVCRRRPTSYQLGDVDGGIVADVRVVGAARDAEAQAGAAPLQHDLLVLPLIVTVHLETKKKSTLLTKFLNVIIGYNVSCVGAVCLDNI